MCKKIAVITPFTEGMIHKKFHKSVLALQKPPNVTELLMKTPDAMEIDTALNVAIAQALRKKVDYIFLWEADMEIPKETLKYLVADNKDVVSGLYFQKVYPHMPVLYEYMNHPTSKYIMRPIYWYDDGIKLKGLRKVDVVGAGCILIKAHVFDKLKQPYFKFFKEDLANKNGQTISADNYFCRQLKEAGIEVYVDTRIVCEHIAVVGISEKHWLRNREKYIKDVESGKIKLKYQIEKNEKKT